MVGPMLASNPPPMNTVYVTVRDSATTLRAATVRERTGAKRRPDSAFPTGARSRTVI